MSDAATATATFTTPAQQALQLLRSQMQAAFVARDAEIDGCLLALLARTHVLLLGPPGTAKSLVTQVFASALGGSYFQRLLTGFTTPDEVFGGPDLAALDAGKGLLRDTRGYLPQATTAFLDEVFKANSAVLNALLTMLNERAFDNGPQRVQCPLQVCVGASNEYPADSSLEALYDRFTLRYWTEYVGTRADRMRLLTCLDPASQVTAQLTAQQVQQLQAQVQQVQVPQGVLECLLDIDAKLASDHGMVVSDRRLRGCIKLLQARALLNGRDTAIKGDLLVLADSLWHRHDERPAVAAVVMELAAPDLATASKLADAAREVYDSIKDYRTDSDVQGKMAKVQRMEEEIEALHSMDPDVQQVLAQVREMRKAIARGFARSSGLLKALSS